jgi:hypothetical protein
MLDAVCSRTRAMSVPAEFTYFPEPRPAVMVVSHERSGTHFLMNALAACYGYVSLPWINLDQPTQNILELMPRHALSRMLLELAERPMANIVKSHHPADFFAGELDRLTERYVILVICRDPVAVMLSFWRYLHRFAPTDNAGPQVADPVAFARAVPFGRMLRYQTEPCASVLHRWAAHVEGWHAAAAVCPRVRLVRYEDLDADYRASVASISALVGHAPESLDRPARDYNVIPPGPADPMQTGMPPDMEALRRLCHETVGQTLARLGYG